MHQVPVRLTDQRPRDQPNPVRKNNWNRWSLGFIDWASFILPRDRLKALTNKMRKYQLLRDRSKAPNWQNWVTKTMIEESRFNRGCNQRPFSWSSTPFGRLKPLGCCIVNELSGRAKCMVKYGFVIYSDDSLRGLGCVLMKHGKVVAYTSRQLKMNTWIELSHPWSRVGKSSLHLEYLEALSI